MLICMHQDSVLDRHLTVNGVSSHEMFNARNNKTKKSELAV